MSQKFNRRRALRGMMGAAAVTVGLPFLDCFLNVNGDALASGAPLPVCFGSWYGALGFNPGRHGLDNMPLITAGGANGRMKTGIHVSAQGDAVTRVGLTAMQALGLPISEWGTESNRTSKTITEVMA